MKILYENHIVIKRDKLCPFKLGTADATLPAPINWHENIEILLVTGGEGAMQYGSRTVPLLLGDISVINSGVLHRPYSLGGLDYYYIIIDESFCRENGLDIAALHFSEHFRDELTKGLFLSAAKATKEYEKNASTLSSMRLRLAMLDLLTDLFERHAVESKTRNEVPSLSEQYVKRVMAYINEHYTERISLDALASLCGVSKCHLSREFKKIAGQTVFEYINVLRCKKAGALLFEGKTATEAAMESGFESLSYFSRTYKRFMGESPSKKCGQK